ncbi:MAG: hypothetical protein M3R24_27685 [Chloroflexota bacterium]|nr:hypothetical protein [Chloroflexota bacterium]
MFVRLPLRLGVALLVLALLGGVIAAPWLSPYIADSQRASAQSLPFTPTPEPTDLPPTDTAAPIAIATATVAPTAAPTATRTPTTAAPVPIIPTPSPTTLPQGDVPDRCEPNDSFVQPCGIPTEIDIKYLNFVDTTPDVYSVLLKANRRYTIRVTSTEGIDPIIAVFLASATATPVVENDDVAPGSGDAMVEITTTAEAWYLIRVDNKAPGDMQGRLYSLAVRSAASDPGNSGKPAPSTQLLGDILENNYDLAHASRIAWGVPYDLSLTCPDNSPGACPGGDHDFLLVPVKANVPLVVATYDLGPGTDTVVGLSRPDALPLSNNGRMAEWPVIATNDDAAPGWTLRSLLTLTPDWTGDALVVVASSERLNPPALPAAAGPPGRYRLIAGSPDMAVVKQVLEGQTDLPPTPVPTPNPAEAAPASSPAPATPPVVEALPVPMPTATLLPLAPTSVPLPAAVAAAPAQDAREVVKETSVRGLAVVSKDGTRLYGAAPPSDGDELASYPEGALVTLLGQSYRGWVKVQPKDSVTPGWMWGPALRLLETTDPDTSPASTTATIGADDSARVAAGTAQPDTTATTTALTAADDTRPARVEELAPRPLTPTTPARPVARTLTIEVCGLSATKGKTCGTPLSGIRIEIVQVATGRIQGQGITDSAGKVTLSLSVPAASKLSLRLPAIGLQTGISDNETLILVRVPGTTGGA